MSTASVESREDQEHAFIGLGSNLDNPVAQIKKAMKSIAALPRTANLISSSFYTNPPMGPTNQPDFVNAVVGLDTSLGLRVLLDELLGIELRQGRVRTGQHWGPRIIDLDILLYGDQQLDSEDLTVPHRGLRERVFVLSPLYEIAPGLVLPGGQRLSDLIERADTDSLVRVDV